MRPSHERHFATAYFRLQLLPELEFDTDSLKSCRARPFGLHTELESETQNGNSGLYGIAPSRVKIPIGKDRWGSADESRGGFAVPGISWNSQLRPDRYRRSLDEVSHWIQWKGLTESSGSGYGGWR